MSGGVPSALFPRAGVTFFFSDVRHLNETGFQSVSLGCFGAAFLKSLLQERNCLTVRCGPLSSFVLLRPKSCMVHPLLNHPLFLGISLSAEDRMAALTFAGFPDRASEDGSVIFK